jgi:hypothetical protein
LKTSGGVWHKKHKDQGEIPRTSIDTEAGWSKSGWHGWWYGWKLHLAVSVGSVWIPLAAELTAANTADNTVAPQLLTPLPAEVRYILGDTHSNDSEVRTQMPVTGLQRSQLLGLGAIVIYQLVLLYQHEHHLPLGKGIKPLLRAA